MTLGSYIKDLRLKKRLTQRQLAEAAGFDFTYLSKIENDRLEHTPSLKTLQTLAIVLEADEFELLALADKMPPILREIADTPEALQFLRKAARIARSPGDWQSLSRHLDALDADANPPKSEG